MPNTWIYGEKRSGWLTTAQQGGSSLWQQQGTYSTIHRNGEFGARARSCMVSDILRLEELETCLSGHWKPRATFCECSGREVQRVRNPSPRSKVTPVRGQRAPEEPHSSATPSLLQFSIYSYLALAALRPVSWNISFSFLFSFFLNFLL